MADDLESLLLESTTAEPLRKTVPKGTKLGFVPTKPQTPWEKRRASTVGLADSFWWAIANNRRQEVLLGRDRSLEERREYARFISDRMQKITAMRDDPYPTSFRHVARESFDKIPRAVLLDLARSNLHDDDIATKVRAYVAFNVRTETQKRYSSLPEDVRERADLFASKPSAALAPGGREAFPSELAGIDLKDPKQTDALLKRVRDPNRSVAEIETAQMAQVFGLSVGTVQSKVADAQGWLTDKILNNAVMDALVKISESPARALDWVAREVSGDDDTSAGQVLFGKDNALSGAADAAKVFFLDAFVVFGKAAKGAKAARGLNRVDDMRNALKSVERGVHSQPVDRFVKWWDRLSPEMRQAGDRYSEMYGWKVKPDAWARLRDAQGSEAIRNVLREEALALGPSGAQNIEALPYLRVTRALRRAWEGGQLGPVSLNNPLLGPTRLTWGNKLDPNFPIFNKHLRRFGDYLWGVTTPGDQAARIVDGHINRITSMHVKGDRTRLMGRFVDEGLAAFATRHGATPEQAAEALARASERYPGFLGRTRRVAYGFDETGALIDTPFRQTQLANAVPVPSYLDLMAYKAELLDVAGGAKGAAKAKLIKSGMALDELAMNVTRLFTRVWLAKPSTLVRAGVEEFIDHAGNPEYGKVFRRQAREQFLDSAAHLLHRGHPLRPPILNDAPEIGREVLMSQQYRGHLGLASNSLTGELIDELAKTSDDIDLDLFHWKGVDAHEATFSAAWYHVVNHQILQDPLSQIIVAYADDMETARAMGRAWLNTPHGQRYLRQLPFEGDAAAKLGTILDWHVADIQRNIPAELLPAAQGGRVSLDLIEQTKLAGRGPQRVVGPVPVSELSAAEAKRLGYFQQGKLNDALQKPYGWGAAVGDYLSRRPGHRAAYTYRRQGLERLRQVRKDAGIDWGLSDDIIDAEAKHYANREMWRMDNPLERSRADFWLRNVLLFSNNQANFMKRWGRRLARNPGYVSRLRQMVGAGEDLGFIQKDENGNLTFQVPISVEFYEALVNRRKQAPKHYARLAFSLGFGATPSGAAVLKSAPFDLFGQLALPPGMPYAASVEPGFGPVITVPVQALVANRPKLDFLRTVLGGYERWDPDTGLAANVLNSISAGWLRDLGQAVGGAAGDRAYAGAVLDIVKWAEMSGKSDIFDPGQQRKWERVTRGWFAFRAMSKFLFPYSAASPVFMEEKEEFDKLIDEHGYEEATKRFLDAHEGNGFSFLLALTEPGKKRGTDQAPKFLMAPSVFAEEFHRDNAEFFEKFPDVAGLFTHNGTDDLYDPTALRRQMQRGQRVGRSLPELWAQLNIEAGQHYYFDKVLPLVEKYRAMGYDDEQLAAAKRASVDALDKVYPGLRTWLDNWSERQGQNKAAIRQLKDAVEDPAVRDREDVAALRTFLSYYDRANTEVQALGYVELGRQKGTAGYRRALAAVYRALMDQSKSAVLEKAYTYLFRGLLEDEELAEPNTTRRTTYNPAIAPAAKYENRDLLYRRSAPGEGTPFRSNLRTPGPSPGYEAPSEFTEV